MEEEPADAGNSRSTRGPGLRHAGAAGAIGEAVAGRLEREGATALFSGLSLDETARRFIHYPMGRFGTLAELAGTAAYLASDDSGFVTGAAFPVGGGIPAAFTVPT